MKLSVTTVSELVAGSSRIRIKPLFLGIESYRYQHLVIGGSVPLRSCFRF